MSYCQLVVFNLGLEEYAINISYAQEIIRIPKFTRLPNTPSFVEGIFNLRGKIIPVFDLKKKFGVAQSERSIDSRLLILELDNMMVGIIVDDVSEVIRVDEQSIQKLDSEIVSISKKSIQGISIIGQRIIILLNALNLKSEIFKYNLEKELA
ncbi:chemotaxis protein CheW [Clostridium estertheticum]|uniref:chemotaxis protein CheW n=1 Tax=Clostridium estertheticum TaxID=238834 RepID=UPI001C6F20BC|nr:chemotaxis protein CheW [Clostridium estertheticum]MBW9153913.1 chemotaxis protein CheW [Clostridium estertheticum]WLC86527.1 chemotaxis protein CheW [Clostridium estertheticum]